MTPIPSYQINDTHHYTAHNMASTAAIREYRDSMGLGTAFFLALLVHAGTILMACLIYAILVLFLKIKIPFFEPLQPRVKDIEFVLVDNNKPEPPRDKHTKNRSDRMSRSGGTKVANRPQAVPQRAAGTPTHKPPQPQRSVSRPTPRPQPSAARPRVVPRPMPKPTPMASPIPVPTPEPPRTAPTPKLPKPTQVATTSPTLPPSPVTPNIKIPIPVSNPRAISSGPVVSSNHGPTGTRSSGGGASGVLGPQAIPGSLSRGTTGYGTSGSSGGRGGQAGGAGGQGYMNQSGSPGGGGGRPGIDAIPEPDFGPYISELQRRIKRNWAPPSSDRSKRVVMIFTIGRAGQLLGSRLKLSSGSPAADQAALDAIRASAPFRPLPTNHRGNSIEVEFTFDYDVYTGGRIR